MLSSSWITRAVSSVKPKQCRTSPQPPTGSRNRSGKSVFSYRTYSSIRKRSADSSSDASKTPFVVEESHLTESMKRALDRDFDETFFRKPKVLIIGTDIAAMTLALTLQSYNIRPDILDTGHYMHPLAPTNVRGSIVPMSSMRVFDQLGIRREIEAIGSPLTLFGRSEDNGKRIASLNFESLRSYQDRPTLGVNHLELERKLQELVSLKSDIQPQCIIESIESPLSTNPVQAQVKWQSNFLSTRTPSKGFYDAVVISEGPFSPTRERVWPQKFDLHGMVNVLETVIPRPPNVMKGYCSDQWGLDRRVGFFPVDHPNKDLLYVYAHFRADTASLEPEQKRVPAMKLVELFQDFTGSWKDIAESIGTLSNINSTILLSGGFIKDVQPLHNRVLALGDSAAVLTTPCFGHEIGIATESASFLGNVLAINNAPVLAGLLTYGERFSTLQPIIDAAKNDVHGSTLMNPNIPKWIAKFIVRRSFSDSALVNQEIDYNNLQSSKQEELDAAPMLRIGNLREEWYKMDEVTRQRSKDELKAERDAAQMQVDEHFSTVLAIEHKKQQEKKPSDL